MMVKPILFNTEMVRAILDGRKSCTRRLVKFSSGENPRWTGYIKDGLMLYNGKNEPCIRKAPYQSGDILYVRETWQYLYELDGNEQVIEDTGKYYYAATDTIPFDTYVDENGVTHDHHAPWRPSIHMPKEAARIWLRVTNVRIERLQDMTPKDAKNEGVGNLFYEDIGYSEKNYGTEVDPEYGIAKEQFAWLWDSTIKKSNLAQYGWDANPYIWVIEFEQCEKPKE